MAFKLGSENREYKNSKNTTFNYKKLDGDTIAQANMDGTVDINLSASLNKKSMKRVLNHELAHIDQIESGRAAYGDNWVMWEDKIYFRKEEDGTPVIDGPNGRWPEGHPNHPWEAEAIQAEKINKLINK
tara:strand:- start:19 stop:405 length:387 start_codon:yes stop_codon:yes gene_type:complete